MSNMLITGYPNYNGCRPGYCVPACETPKPREIRARRKIARRRERREWQRDQEV